MDTIMKYLLLNKRLKSDQELRVWFEDNKCIAYLSNEDLSRGREVETKAATVSAALGALERKLYREAMKTRV